MRRNRALETDGEDRAVSEVLSFVLVFGIILTGVAVLSMTGFQAMEDYQDTEQLRNGERAMDALADNFNDVLRYDGIDQRYGELSLRGGTVTTGSDGTEVTIDFETPDEEEFDETYDLGTFKYEYDSETVAYEGGGVVRASESGGSVMLEDPLLTCREDGTALVSLVKVDADDRSIQSSDGVGFTANVEERTSEMHEVDGDISITVDDGETSYEDAWTTVQENWGEDGCSPERVQITVVTIDINY